MESVIYEKNCKLLTSYMNNWQKQINTLKRKAPKYNNEISYDNMSKVPLVVSCIPTAITSLPVLVGALGVAANIVGLFGCALANRPESAINNLSLNAEKCLQMITTHFKFAAMSAVLPGSIYAGMKFKDKIGSIKKEKADDMYDAIESMSKYCDFISSLKYRGQSSEFDIIKDILSKVDITKNKKEFNIELIEVLSNYHCYLDDQKECFKDVFEFLFYSLSDSRASKSFRNSPYVQKLVGWYSKDYLENASHHYNNRSLAIRLGKK